MRRSTKLIGAIGLAVGFGVMPLARGGDGTAGATAPHALLVGTFNGVRGQFATIQAAVDAAHPGDWVLVAPGDYHETDDMAHPPGPGDHGQFGGVVITTPGVHVRGMQRNHTIVDGTLPGGRRPCTADAAFQNLGTLDANGRPRGRNGIVVYQADGVSVENLTVCNFLSGAANSGNGIWWNGGDDIGAIGLRGYTGRYLTATSTFYGDGSNGAKYGIFAVDSGGPSLWDQVYASNFNDSGMYIGACLRECDVTVRHAWMQYSALGYSGTNSGGSIVITNSQFDHNKDGFDTNTQIAGDPPPPQDGRCANDRISPITHTHSCWVFMHNWVHDNNNPNVPAAGSADLGPVGTGMTISGGRFNTITQNIFSRNGAWGLLVVPFPDDGTPHPPTTCEGVGGTQLPGFGCALESEGNAIVQNTFLHNGFFGNPSNGDIGELVIVPGRQQNCYRANAVPDGITPANLQTTQRVCGAVQTAADLDPDLLAQVLCDTGFADCPPGSVYPQQTKVVMHPLPALATMANPCVGVPINAWCPRPH